VALSGDGKHVLTASEGDDAVLWDAASGKQVRSLAGHTQAILALA